MYIKPPLNKANPTVCETSEYRKIQSQLIDRKIFLYHNGRTVFSEVLTICQIRRIGVPFNEMGFSKVCPTEQELDVT